MDEREDRMVQNEALFRRVNERLKELGESFSLVAEHAQFVCECADPTCAEPISLTLEEYEQVRAEPGHFVLARGHERSEVDRVVRATEHFVVVEKPLGELAEAAVDLDPRAEP